MKIDKSNMSLLIALLISILLIIVLTIKVVSIENTTRVLPGATPEVCPGQRPCCRDCNCDDEVRVILL